MNNFGMWHVEPGKSPERLQSTSVPDEEQLEDWIEADPTLIAPGLQSVQRQVRLGTKALDLLAVEAPGTWVLCELKKINLERDVFAQAFDYFARMSEFSFSQMRDLVTQSPGYITGESRELIERALAREENGEERELRMVLVGVEVKEELRRMVDLMSERYRVPVEICTFTASASPVDDGLILMRDTSQDEEIDDNHGTTYEQRMDSVVGKFKSNGTDSWLASVCDIIDKNPNLYLAPHKHSLKIAPERHHGRWLIFLTPRKEGVYGSFSIQAIEEFFPSTDFTEIDTFVDDVVFETKDELVRWVQDISDAIGNDETHSQAPSPNWNGRDWYVSFGQEPGVRDWEDARECGFISAGGGKWYSQTLKSVPIGANVFARIPKIGYVGYGVTTGEAVTRDNFPDLEGKEMVGAYLHENGEPEYFVPVNWKKTLPEKEGLDEGLFSNEHSACRLRDLKTVRRLHEYFGVPE